MDIDQLEDPHYIETAMGNALKVIISNELREYHSSQIIDMYNAFEKEDDSIRGAFCDHFDLGESIYDSFDLHDVDVDKTIMDIYSKRLLVEAEVNKQ